MTLTDEQIERLDEAMRSTSFTQARWHAVVAALIAEAVEQARAEIAREIDQMRADLTDESVPREKWGRHVNGWATGMERAARIARGEVSP